MPHLRQIIDWWTEISHLNQLPLSDLSLLYVASFRRRVLELRMWQPFTLMFHAPRIFCKRWYFIEHLVQVPTDFFGFGIDCVADSDLVLILYPISALVLPVEQEKLPAGSFFPLQAEAADFRFFLFGHFFRQVSRDSCTTGFSCWGTTVVFLYFGNSFYLRNSVIVSPTLATLTASVCLAYLQRWQLNLFHCP